MKRMTLLVAVLLALLLPLSVLADAAPPAAPEALDMTAPLEEPYQFDFLPWFTTFDDALAAFDLEAATTADHRRDDPSWSQAAAYWSSVSIRTDRNDARAS